MATQTELLQHIVENQQVQLQQQQQHQQAPREATFQEFLSTQPPLFTRAEGPLDVDAWISIIESRFMLLTHPCSGQRKAIFAAEQLRGAAKLWWDDLMRMPDVDHVFTWEGFKTAFKAHHVPMSRDDPESVDRHPTSPLSVTWADQLATMVEMQERVTQDLEVWVQDLTQYRSQAATTSTTTATAILLRSMGKSIAAQARLLNLLMQDTDQNQQGPLGPENSSPSTHSPLSQMENTMGKIATPVEQAVKEPDYIASPEPAADIYDVDLNEWEVTCTMFCPKPKKQKRKRKGKKGKNELCLNCGGKGYIARNCHLQTRKATLEQPIIMQDSLLPPICFEQTGSGTLKKEPEDGIMPLSPR